MPVLLSVKAAAQLLGIKTPTLYEWVRISYVPCLKVGPGKRQRTLFNTSALIAWLEAKDNPGRTSRIPTSI